MAVVTTKPEADQQNSEMVRQIKRVNVAVLVLALVLIIVPSAWTWWVARQLPVVNTVKVDNVHVVDTAVLCPGEPLRYAYDFHAAGAGVLVRDRVIWRLTPPPKTVVFSTSRRFILTEPIEQKLTEAWHIPTMFVNPETDALEPFPPGDYRLIFAISSPSRSTVVAIASVDFSVRQEGCQ